MGTILYTDDGDELSDHEGYLDGWSDSRPTFTPACSCGWEGDAIPGWSPGEDTDDNRYDEAMEQWYHEHADPLRRQLQLLGPITKAGYARTEAEIVLVSAVWRALDGGASWTQIGGALGVSKQTAWDRYAKDYQQRQALTITGVT